MFPVIEDENSLATIIGLDPGTTYLGVAEFVFDIFERKMISIKAYTLNANKLYRFENEHMIRKLGERAWRIYCLQKRLLHIFKITKADSIVYEHPFYNPRRPQAFQALLEAKAAIANAAIQYDSEISAIPIDPSSIKNSVGAKGNVGKDPIREAILGLYPKDILTLPQGDLDEHSCDAIAAAHCYFTRRLGSR